MFGLPRREMTLSTKPKKIKTATRSIIKACPLLKSRTGVYTYLTIMAIKNLAVGLVSVGGIVVLVGQFVME